LDAVAAPRHAPLRIALRFLASGADAPPVEVQSTLLPTCAYITGALETEEASLSAALGAVSLDDAATPAALPEISIPEQFPVREHLTDLATRCALLTTTLLRAHPPARPVFRPRTRGCTPGSGHRRRHHGAACVACQRRIIHRAHGGNHSAG
jgi:hypothetical protein